MWPGTNMMPSLMQLIAHFAIPVPISLSACPNRLKIDKLEDDLHLFGEPCPQNYKKSSLNEMVKIFHCSCTWHTFTSPLHLGSQERSGETSFRLAPPDCEQLFEITVPNMCAPGISDDVLQQIISQASQPAQNGAVLV